MMKRMTKFLFASKVAHQVFVWCRVVRAMFATPKITLYRLFIWYMTLRRRMTLTTFGWNQLMDLGIVIGLLFVFVQNNATLSTLFTTIVTAVQSELQKLITQNQL